MAVEPQVLEEDTVQLSTIKASKFYNSFAEKIDRWEKALNGVSETVDLILTVQKKWMYLESIFMASEDICKQLPRESAIFLQVTLVFRRAKWMFDVELTILVIRSYEVQATTIDDSSMAFLTEALS